jgi:hypothetical protein
MKLSGYGRWHMTKRSWVILVGISPTTVYWTDVSHATYYIKEKLKIQVAKWGTPKKYLIKRGCKHLH